ncbi:MAG: NAD-dependent epimerase/dehydratase family protein [Planctomycetota bacterium]
MTKTTRRTFLHQTALAGAILGMPLSRVAAAQERAAAGPVEKAAKRLKLLILGGTGFLGPHVVRHALARGHEMTLFNRGRTNAELFPELEKLLGDRDPQKGEGLKALEGRDWDGVIDTSSYVPRITSASATLLAPHVGHYVLVSSVSAYGDFSQPGIAEDAAVATMEDATVEEITGTTYGPLKALCEAAAEAAMPGRVANVRPGLIVGPGDPSDRFTYWPVRVERGGEVLAPVAPSEPVQYIDGRDLAAWIVHLIERRTAGVLNAVGPKEPTTIGALLESCQEVTKSDATFTWADLEFLSAQGVEPWGHLPVWVPSAGDSRGLVAVSNTKALAAGLAFRPVEETVTDLLAWIHGLEDAPARLAKLRAGLTPEREAEVLAAWHAREK